MTPVIYFYIPAAEAEEAAECGISLERYATGTVRVGGVEKKFLTAFLHPKDDPEKFGSPDHACIQIEADERYVYISDGAVREAAESEGRLAGAFDAMAVPLKEYIFGSFRKPVCMVVSTVLPENASIAGKVMGSPLIYNDSEEFFVECLFEKMRGADEGFVEKALYRFMNDLAARGKAEKFESRKSGTAVFRLPDSTEFIPLKIPPEE